MTNTRSWWRWGTFDRFDGLVIGVLIALLAAIGAVIVRGDQIAVRVDEYAPQTAAGGTEPIHIRFSDAMKPVSVALHITPEIAGDVAWTAPDTLTFTPRQPFAAGETVTVTVSAGAKTAHRSARLAEDFRWSFTIRPPRAVYLGPADAADRTLWLADPTTGDPVQITNADHGIEDYAVSPDGRRIAYAQNNPDGSADLWIVDVWTHAARPITACVRARCFNPAWKPDGTQLIYQRQDRNPGASRAWIVDLETLETQLLFSDVTILGEDPLWSPDGSRIAVYDAAAPGIRVHDLAAGVDDVILDSELGVSGAFSPDGRRLVYPILERGAIGLEFYTHLEMVDFDAQTVTRLSGQPETPVEDGVAAWSPDGSRMVITRRYLDERFTNGKQLYLMDVESGDVTPLVVDAAYTHAAPAWDTAGQRIVFQRFSLIEPGALPEIWTLDLSTGEPVLAAENAFLPAWAP